MRVNFGYEPIQALLQLSLPQSSQYSDETATLLAKELLRDATATTRIAVVSAPSVFIQLKNLMVGSPDLGVECARRCNH